MMLTIKHMMYGLICALILFSCGKQDTTAHTLKKEAISPKSPGTQLQVLRGIYRGKNIFIQNLYDDNSHSCIERIIINGDPSTKYTSGFSTAFEVSLDDQGLSVGDSFFVTIQHGVDCIPKILNPQSF